MNDYREFFPNLNDQNHKTTSVWDETYNCIAWAAGSSDQWWDVESGYHWPEGARSGKDVVNPVEAFRTLGYVHCIDGQHEEEFEKVALYAKGSEWTHAARQLPNGSWTSKLGSAEDIEHLSPELIQGTVYGSVHCFMKKKKC